MGIPRSFSPKTKAIIIAVIATILMSFSQMLWKIGSSSFDTDFIKLLTNIPLIAGFAIYGFCAVLMVISLRNGELSTIYPIFALSFVFVNILAWLILYENMNVFKWIGVLAIIIGITIIGFGSDKDNKSQKTEGSHSSYHSKGGI
jgi:uncharacterized membrane protein